jgi:hypothetical protein
MYVIALERMSEINCPKQNPELNAFERQKWHSSVFSHFFLLQALSQNAQSRLKKAATNETAHSGTLD